jgi:hypothetical protein
MLFIIAPSEKFIFSHFEIYGFERQVQNRRSDDLQLVGGADKNAFLQDFEFHQEAACKKTRSQGMKNDSQW